MATAPASESYIKHESYFANLYVQEGSPNLFSLNKIKFASNLPFHWVGRKHSGSSLLQGLARVRTVLLGLQHLTAADCLIVQAHLLASVSSKGVLFTAETCTKVCGTVRVGTGSPGLWLPSPGAAKSAQLCTCSADPRRTHSLAHGAVPCYTSLQQLLLLPVHSPQRPHSYVSLPLNLTGSLHLSTCPGVQHVCEQE